MSKCSRWILQRVHVVHLTFFRELLLIDGLLASGMGSWADAAEHIGTFTREDAEKHYNEVYVQSPDWPMPVRDSQQCCWNMS